MRKDVECTFGIMKGRWRILKAGIRTHRLKTADDIWKTCCALHNWLLEEDGLDERWEQGIPSLWEGPEGYHDVDDLAAIGAIAGGVAGGVALVENHRTELQTYDCSGMGHGNDDEDDNIDNNTDTEEEEDAVGEGADGWAAGNNVRIVRQMSGQAFRRKLVTHFDIASEKGEVRWPKKNNTNPAEQEQDEAGG